MGRGIPETVGGSVVMNAGCTKDVLEDILVSVDVLNPDGTIETLSPNQLGYQYRTSNLQNGGRYVIQATFQFAMGYSPRSVQEETTLISTVGEQHPAPYDRPVAAVCFGNPGPHSAGWLIEQVGFEGIASAEHRYERHACELHSLNCGGANSQHILT
jgi:UDP-N-acetylmuramate dehydrogenase